MRRGITRPQGAHARVCTRLAVMPSYKFINGAEDRGYRVLPAP
jgi:hypothetical protein